MPGSALAVTGNVTLYARWAPVLEYEKHLKYLNGYPDGSVRPDGSITRGEAASIFHRLIITGDKNDPLATRFSDIVLGDWFYQQVTYLEKHGIIEGYPNGTFRPNNHISRAEFATIASRFGKLEIDVPNVFSDVPDDHWAVGNISSAAAKGWIDSEPGSSFRPEENITRAEVVNFVNRMLERGIEMENIPAGIPQYTDITTAHWAYCDIIEASIAHEYEINAAGKEIWLSW